VQFCSGGARLQSVQVHLVIAGRDGLLGRATRYTVDGPGIESRGGGGGVEFSAV